MGHESAPHTLHRIAIRDSGGLQLADGSVIIPDPILVGRNLTKLQELAFKYDIPEKRITTSLDSALDDPYNTIFFDAGTTQMRYDLVLRAIAAGKHIYVEKPSASTLDQSLELADRAQKAGIKHGVVQDKLFLPGMLKLSRLIRSGFFGDILSVRGEFGYWVFSGLEEDQTPQRPSWNYRAEDGGGIMSDMLPHWRYLLDHLFGAVQAVSCTARTEVKERVDEAGKKYSCTADDACYAQFELGNGAIATFNSSWNTRVRRDDLLTIQVDGTKGSAVAGLTECRVQGGNDTPRPVWNPDIKGTIDHRDAWSEVGRRRRDSQECVQAAMGDVPEVCRKRRSMDVWTR